jgi:flagellar biosynthesis/type III secretory pathway M-ring protein FliF/YscJ
MPKWLEPLMKTAPMPVWLGAAGALLVVFGTILYLLVRRFLKKEGAVTSVPGQPALPEAARQEQLSPGEAKQQFEDKAHALLAANEADREKAEQDALATLRLPPNTMKTEVLKKVLADDAKKDPARMAQLVRTWLNEKPR